MRFALKLEAGSARPTQLAQISASLFMVRQVHHERTEARQPDPSSPR
jgi:hypothetical protein